MNEEKDIVELFDRKLARAYMEKALREGRTEDDGFGDYLETLGIRRPEATDAVLEKFNKENDESNARIMANLAEIRRIARAAQQRYAGL